MRPPSLDEIRQHRLLPSDCLDIARKKNPGVTIELAPREHADKEYLSRARSGFVLRVKTARGELVYEKREFENWSDVFRRADLL